MNKNKAKTIECIRSKILFFTSIIFLLFLLWGCSSTPKFDKDGNPIYTYKIEEKLDFPELEEPYKYIFLRLYDVDYINPFYVANILKFGINCTEVNDTKASHAAMNFTLNDDFYGLTSGGEYQLAKEACTDTKSNKFLKKCNPDTSEQITYAVKVSEEEYYNTKKFVESYAADPKIRYSASLNFKIAPFSIKRKFFTKKENRKIGSLEYPEPKKKEKEREDSPDYVEYKFVCSTFVAYTLMKNVEYIGEWFEENSVNYRYVGVTDIPEIPGVVRLFSSKFYEYNIAAQAFINKYPEFEEYFDFTPELVIEIIPDADLELKLDTELAPELYTDYKEEDIKLNEEDAKSELLENIQ